MKLTTRADSFCSYTSMISDTRTSSPWSCSFTHTQTYYIHTQHTQTHYIHTQHTHAQYIHTQHTNACFIELINLQTSKHSVLYSK